MQSGDKGRPLLRGRSGRRAVPSALGRRGLVRDDFVLRSLAALTVLATSGGVCSTRGRPTRRWGSLVAPSEGVRRDPAREAGTDTGWVDVHENGSSCTEPDSVP